MREATRETREEQAAREAGRTDVRPAVARALSAAFLLLLGAVAAVELVRDAGAASGSPWPDLVAAPERAWEAARRSGPAAGNRGLLAAMAAFEDALEERSVVGERAGAGVQWVLTRGLGTGNEQVVVGREGWLYFRPSVEYLTGPGFLAGGGGRASGPASSVARGSEYRRLSSGPPPADPVAVLADFAAQLADRGIGLVVVPTPVKASIHPEGLAPALARARLPLENPSFDRFLERLAELEIPAFAPGEGLALGRRERPQFLRTDTHWTPAAMEDAAQGLAGFLTRRPLPEAPGASYVRRPVAVRGRGDLAALLRASPGRALFRPEGVLTQRVTMPTGEPWSPDPEADLLLLGDSFSNVYSQADLGWGDAAGFAEQLSYFLGRPVDKLAVNAGGPSAVRERLAARLAAGDDRLAGKRLVVYQFAARELAAGEWRFVDLGRTSTRPRRPEDPLPARGFAVWESNRGGDWRIWTRRLEGSPARALTPDEPGLQHCCPHISPGGSHLVYLSRRISADEYPPDQSTGELRLLRLDGGGQRVLVPDARTYGAGNRAAIWRNDRELIYVGADGRTFLVDVTEGRSRALTVERRGRLAWLLDPTLRHAVNGSPTFSSYDAARREVVEGPRHPGCEPYFSHDGRFGYWVTRGGGPVPRLDLRTGAIGALLGSADRRIPGAQRYVYFPMVSRDGRMLAFGASAGDHDHSRSNYDVFAAPLDPASLELAGRPARLTAHPASDRYPDLHVEALDLARWQREAPPVPEGPAAPSPPPAQPLDVRAVLRACSRPYSLREISPYRAALMVCEWEPGEVLAGAVTGTRLRVAHWSVRDGNPLPIASALPGMAARLRLEPLIGALQMEGYPISDTLPPAPEVPLHYAPEL